MTDPTYPQECAFCGTRPALPDSPFCGEQCAARWEIEFEAGMAYGTGGDDDNEYGEDEA